MSTTTKKSNLFSEFSGISAKEWKQIIQAELKGADYNETLVRESLEGIKVKPFYHPDDAEYLDIPALPKDFDIAQSIFVDDESISNKIALEALDKGADCIIFEAQQSFDIDVLLQGFDRVKCKKIQFQFYFISPEFIKSIIESYPQLPIEFSIDIIGNRNKTGNWLTNETVDTEQIRTIIGLVKPRTLVSVRADYYQQAGANTVQQIAYALLQAAEYHKLLPTNFAGKIIFHFAVGSNFFFEIAKLRAFRYLWNEWITTNAIANVEMELWCRPSLRNKTLYDFNVNLLRTATEKLSAVLGGADVVQTLPYDAFFKKSNGFSERIARNQLLLLKHETELQEPAQVAQGSYYIEALTLEMTKKALELLQDIEKNKGLLHQLKEGTIQKKIKEAADKEQQLFDEQKLILIGSNRFPLATDHPKDYIELFPFTKKRNEKTEIIPLVATRLSEKYEIERVGEL